jgi:hypothetical protein
VNDVTVPAIRVFGVVQMSFSLVPAYNTYILVLSYLIICFTFFTDCLPNHFLFLVKLDETNPSYYK